jgi:hypothetical protein
MAGQIRQRGERTWLVRWFLGRNAQGKREYEAATVHRTKKEARRSSEKSWARLTRARICPALAAFW